jgi:hypothetical protein
MAHYYTDMRQSARLDPEEIKKAKVDLATVRRAWGFARAYRGYLIAYLGTIVLAALVGTLPPLVFKALIDNALPPGYRDSGLVNWLFAAAVALAVVTTGLNLVNPVARVHDRRRPDLRSPCRPVRPRPADADRLLHPNADRFAHVPAVERRARGTTDRWDGRQRDVGPLHARV